MFLDFYISCTKQKIRNYGKPPKWSPEITTLYLHNFEDLRSNDKESRYVRPETKRVIGHRVISYQDHFVPSVAPYQKFALIDLFFAPAKERNNSLFSE